MANEELKRRNLNRVLQTAYEQFLAYGIENTTKELLTRASGVSRTSLDRYFRNKVDCVLQTAAWMGENLQFWYDNTNGETNNSATGFELLKIFAASLRKMFISMPRVFILRENFRNYLHRNAANFETAYAQLNNALGSCWVLETFFKKGIADGSLSPSLNPEQEAVFFSETIFGFLASLAMLQNPTAPENIAMIDRYIERMMTLYAVR